MSLQKKYYFTFKQIGTDDVNTVEIWQDTEDVLVAEEVTGMASPFVVELPELDHKFQPVLGQGCEIGLLSETDRKFYDGLYHVDPQEFQVRHYIGTNLNYIGYLNSEMYMESYDSDVSYGTSISGNDGLAIADRFTFVQSDDSHYSGVYSEWDLLIICLNKIGLPWDEIRVCLATTFTNYSSSANVTVLHETYIDAANYYDEDNYPMTIREVLESILQPYGAQLFIQNGHVYIVDVHSRTVGINDNFTTIPTFKRFDYSTEVYIADISESINKTIQSIGYSGTGQSIELSGGVNKQVVTYSPYTTNVVLENTLVGLDEFGTIPSSWIAREDYFYKVLYNNQYLQILSSPIIANFESSYYDGTVDGQSVQDNTDGYLNYKHDNTNVNVMDLLTKPYVSISSKPTIIVDDEYQGAAISLTFDFLCTFDDSKVYRRIRQHETGTRTGDKFNGIRLYFKLSIGSLFYDGETQTWVNDSSKEFYIEFANKPQREKWITATKIIEVGDLNSDILLSGDLNLIVNSKIETYNIYSGSNNDAWEAPDTQRPGYPTPYYPRKVMIWMKNLNIDVKNADDTDIPDDDVEYVGILDERFKNSGEKITLTTGTDTYSSDRGKMLYLDGSDYKSIKEWNRAGQTYKIEELLLNSLVSNYRFGFIKLNNLRLRQNFSILNVITDNNISDKVFMLKNAKFDYAMNDVEVSLWETSPDSLTIVK